MPRLTADQILAHPQYKNIIWDLPPTKKGKVEVAKSRGGPFKIAYEIHGHGDTKLLVSQGRVFLSPCSSLFEMSL